MAYTQEELSTKLKAVYDEEGVSGELVDLVVKLLSEYLYLHQMEDVNILMEDSFLRCKLLNSSIQHAADHFYSVERGSNRKIHINNLGCLSKVNVNQFDTVSSYGQYKLVYDQNYTHSDPSEPFEFSGYLTVDSAQVLTTEGNGKYYIDITDENGDLVKNISENIMVMSIDDRGTSSTVDDKQHIFKISRNLLDLYTDGDTTTGDASTNDDSIVTKKAEICAMTLPNYGVRLWKADKFQPNFTYVIKYLKAPDTTKPEIDITTDIRSIPGYTKNVNGENTVISVEEEQCFKNDDMDAIYLNTASQSRFQGTMKSLNSLDDLIQSNLALTYSIEGFKTVIGPSTSPAVQNGNIAVYCTFTGHEDATSDKLASMKTACENILKAYYINNDISFNNADKTDMTSTTIESTSNVQNLYIDVHYTDIIETAVVENLVDNKMYLVGQDFNPYQLIADLMSNDSLQGKLSLVEVYWKDSSGGKIYPTPTTLLPNQCIQFKAIISYISER